MLTFYPEFETNSDVESEVILVIDASNSMKVWKIFSAETVICTE